MFSWVPPLGYNPLTQNPLLWFEGLIFPWITLSILYIGFYARVLRANLLEIQTEDYVRTARAKGLSEQRVLDRHTLRTSLITFVSLFGLDFGALVGGGTILTEVVFGIHGVGFLTYEALTNLDLPTIMATVIYGAFFIVLANALVDVAYAWLDPRVRPSLMADPLLEIRDLGSPSAPTMASSRPSTASRRRCNEGETLGIVGESGSGKSVTMMTVMRLIIDPNAQFEGEVLYKGTNLMELSQDQIRSIRGAGIGMIFQDPMTSLNPVYKVGWQIEEQIREHEKVSKQAARDRAIELLAAVGIPNARERVDAYPHQFSGGMRQRVMIAMAVSCNPDLLIADEPTTALDVTIQAQILNLIKKLREDFGTAVVLITHDMGVVADMADRIAVMYAGRIVEQGTQRELFYDPQHPYTWGLLGSIARLDRPRPRRLAAIPGLPPSLLRLPAGCAFADRCSTGSSGATSGRNCSTGVGDGPPGRAVT